MKKTLVTQEDHQQATLLALKLRELRRRRGWTQREAAQATGLSVSTLQRFEHGQVARLSPRSRCRLAQAYDLYPGAGSWWLSGDADHRPPATTSGQLTYAYDHERHVWLRRRGFTVYLRQTWLAVQRVLARVGEATREVLIDG